MDDDGHWRILDARTQVFRLDPGSKRVSHSRLSYVQHISVCPKLRRKDAERETTDSDSDESG